MFLQRGRRPGDVSGQEMSAAEADFCGKSSRISAVKAEVLYEYDSKHRAVKLIHECILSRGNWCFFNTNQQTRSALAAAKQYIRPMYSSLVPPKLSFMIALVHNPTGEVTEVQVPTFRLSLFGRFFLLSKSTPEQTKIGELDVQEVLLDD